MAKVQYNRFSISVEKDGKLAVFFENHVLATIESVEEGRVFITTIAMYSSEFEGQNYGQVRKYLEDNGFLKTDLEKSQEV